ncbi:MAG: fibrillarin-like rRNA/tRNA 2'-O-methyltransferase [Candidatus Helarchaeales archaeon]
MRVKPYKNYTGVYTYVTEEGYERIATKAVIKGQQVYGEKIVTQDGIEYRTWDPKRSKLAAGIVKNMIPDVIKEGQKILYLGAASGTTASHVSDIIEEQGTLFCIEFSPRVCRELVTISEPRANMIPILADARFPEKYRALVENVDLIYSDVAQPEQAEIICSNARWYLNPGGWLILCVKARSVDVTKKPSEVYESQIEVIKQAGHEVEQIIDLSPHSEDHAMIIARS